MVIFFTLVQGLKAYGKVAYVITLSPYVVLTALLIYAAQLPGAGDGIDFYINPEWEKLLDFNIWATAASQILFSLSVGFGSQLILSTYNQFNNNTHRDAILIAIFNSLTSIYAGFVVFCVLGYLGYTTNKDVGDVVESGIKLAFVSYPAAVLEMDVPPLWSFLFFFMLLNLAMSSICGGMQCFIAFVLDEWPSLEPHRIKILGCLCLFFFLCGLPMCAEGGLLIFTIFDNRCTDSLLFLTALEVIAVAWFYGINNFLKNVEEMGMDLTSGPKIGGLTLNFANLWKGILCVVTPLWLTVITIADWAQKEDLELDGYVYPDAWQAVGWAMELAPLAVVLLFPVYTLFWAKRRLPPGQSLWKKLISPTHNWFEKGGPPDDHDYTAGGKAGDADGDDGPVVYTITERRKTSEMNGALS